MKFTTHKFQKQRSVERNRRAANKKYYLRYKLNEARVDNFLEDVLSRVLEWRVVDIYIYRFKSHLAAFETHTHTLHVYQDLWLASRSSSIIEKVKRENRCSTELTNQEKVKCGYVFENYLTQQKVIPIAETCNLQRDLYCHHASSLSYRAESSLSTYQSRRERSPLARSAAKSRGVRGQF